MKSIFLDTLARFNVVLFILTIAQLGEADEIQESTPTPTSNEEERMPITETERSGKEAGTSAACFPACRSGFLCHQGKCISRCNPPCPTEANCTDKGECTQHPQGSAVQPEPETSTREREMSIAPVYEGGEPAIEREGEMARFNSTGFMFTFGIGPSFSAYFEENHDEVYNPNKQVGLAIASQIGGRVLPWISVEGTITFTPVVIQNEGSGSTTQNQLEIGAGVSFYVMSGHYRADLVLGLHFGYARNSYSYNNEFQKVETQLHGVYLSYFSGLLVHVARPLSLIIGANYVEPFWISVKSEWNEDTNENEYRGDHRSLDIRPGVFIMGVF